jgi:hypothetical protein
MALLRLLQHDFADALRWADSALAVDSMFLQAYVDRARTHRLLGDTAGARRDADALQRFANAGTQRWAEVARALADAAAGDTLAARARVDRLYHEVATRDTTGPILVFRERVYLAIALAVAGDAERALSTLESARRWGLFLGGLLRAPEFDVIRDQPRFQRLVEELRP